MLTVGLNTDGRAQALNIRIITVVADYDPQTAWLGIDPEHLKKEMSICYVTYYKRTSYHGNRVTNFQDPFEYEIRHQTMDTLEGC